MRPTQFAKVSVVLAGMYIGAYATLLQPEEFSFCWLSASPSMPVDRVARYRLQNDACQKAFKPLVWLDQKIRPGYWHYHKTLGGPPYAGGGEFGFGGYPPRFDASESDINNEQDAAAAELNSAQRGGVDR